MSNLNQYILSLFTSNTKSLGLTFLARGASTGGVLLLTALINAILGLSLASDFFIAYVYLNLVGIILRFGLDTHLIRQVAASHNRQIQAEKYLSINYFCIVISIAASLISLAFWMYSGFNTQPIYMLWGAIIPFVAMNITAAFAKALGKPAVGALLEIGIISTAVAIILIASSHQATELSATSIWIYLCITAWIIFLPTTGYTIFWSLKLTTRIPPLNLSIISESWQIGTSTILSYLAQWGALIIAGLVMTGEGLAIMNGIFRLIAPLQFLALTLDNFLAPKFASNFALMKFEKNRQYRLFGAAVTVSFGLLYAIILLYFPHYSAFYILGNIHYEYQLEITAMVIFNLIFLAMGSNGQILIALNQDRTIIKGTIFRAALAMILYTLLIPKFGVLGGCIGYGLSMLLTSVYYRITASDRINSNGAK